MDRRLKMLPRDARGHTEWTLSRCEGWMLHYVNVAGGAHTYNDTPLTALGVLEAINWATRVGLAYEFSVTAACACD